MPEECLTTGLSKIAEIAATVESTKQILLVKTYLNEKKKYESPWKTCQRGKKVSFEM